MQRHARSIYGCTQAPAAFKCPRDCRLTYNPKTRRLYVHVFAWPFRQLYLDGFAGKVEYAQLLNDASQVIFREREAWQRTEADKKYRNTITLELPVRKPDATVPVIELFLK
jgi:alpha-L-fucosidase